MGRTQVIIGTSIVVALGLVGLWAMSSAPTGATEPSGSQPPAHIDIDDPDDIRAQVELSRLAILTSENFVGHKIRVIEGSVTNQSADRTFHSVALKLTFTDYEGVSIQESEEDALATGGPLAPGERRRFSYRFENLPTNWNFRVPIGEIVRLGY